jgi:hypothetical protein
LLGGRDAIRSSVPLDECTEFAGVLQYSSGHSTMASVRSLRTVECASGLRTAGGDHHPINAYISGFRSRGGLSGESLRSIRLSWGEAEKETVVPYGSEDSYLLPWTDRLYGSVTRARVEVLRRALGQTVADTRQVSVGWLRRCDRVEEPQKQDSRLSTGYRRARMDEYESLVTSHSAPYERDCGEIGAVRESAEGGTDPWRDRLCISLIREDCDRVRRGLVQLRSDMNSTLSVGMASVGLLVSAGAAALQAYTPTSQVLAAVVFLFLLPAFCTVMAVLYYSAAEQQQQGGLYLFYREELLNRMARGPAEILESMHKSTSDLPMAGESIFWEAYRRCPDVDANGNAFSASSGPVTDSFSRAQGNVAHRGIFRPMRTRQRRYPYVLVLAGFLGAAVVTWFFGSYVARSLEDLVSHAVWNVGLILALTVFGAVLVSAILIIRSGLRLR